MKTLLVGLLASLVLASTAAAGNWPDTRLDAAASAVAGQPINVWCETSWTDWVHLGDSQSTDFNDILGFSFPGQSTTIFIGPTQCENLHLLLQLGPAEVGPALASLAVHTLVHESTHILLNSGDEGLVDCNALQHDDAIAVQFFGFQTMDTLSNSSVVPVTKVVPVTRTEPVRKKRNGKLAIVGLKTVVVGHKTVIVSYKTVTTTSQVPSALLAGFHADDLAWHKNTPPQYQTTC